METNKTYYDGLKAKITVHPRPEDQGPQFNWEIRDSADQLMAAGEEYRFHHALSVAREAVGALRTWSVF